LVDRSIGPFVTVSKRLGLTPDVISLVAFFAAVGAGGLFFLARTDPIYYLGGSVLVLSNGALDLLDGALAREQGADSRAGDFLDHVADRYADIAIIAGLAGGVGRPTVGFAAVTGVLMTSYLGTQSQAVGIERTYGGLLGRADRLVLVMLAGLVGTVFTASVYGFTVVGWLLLVFAVVGHVTALQRFWVGWRALSA
jgi:archaetidylinositol phosphate synthase